MNKNRIEGRPRCDELAQHSEVAGSVAEVPPRAGPPVEENAAVPASPRLCRASAPGSNAFLPGEVQEPEAAPGNQPRP